MTGEKNKECINCKHWLRVQSFMGRCQNELVRRSDETKGTGLANELTAEKETCALWEENPKNEFIISKDEK